MWGTKLNNKDQREKWRQSWKTILESGAGDKHGYDADQQILRQHVWHWARHDVLQHGSYLCLQYPGSVGLPTQRNNTSNNFVGAVVNFHHPGIYKLWRECPRECRREGRKDEWIHC